jgi:hypothetical protein
LGFGGDLMLLERWNEGSSDLVENMIWVNCLALLKSTIIEKFYLFLTECCLQ